MESDSSLAGALSTLQQHEQLPEQLQVQLSRAWVYPIEASSESHCPVSYMYFYRI